MRLKAYGTPAFGVWPRMLVRVDGRKIGEVDVKDGWHEYHFSAEIKTGRYRVDAAFVNDDGGPGEDRNLFVGDMKIYYR